MVGSMVAVAVEKPRTVGEVLRFRLVGLDRPGILRQVAGILGRLDIDVETTCARVSAAPHFGASMFHLEARLRLPAGLNASDVQASMEEISPEIAVDLSAA